LFPGAGRCYRVTKVGAKARGRGGKGQVQALAEERGICVRLLKSCKYVTDKSHPDFLLEF
jgi:hypothetical protein